MERDVQPANIDDRIICILEETLTDCRLLQLLKGDPRETPDNVTLLLEKSMLPERFLQLANALNASPPKLPWLKFNDIGANNSNPVPLQFWKAPGPIALILEEKDATSLWQLSNACVPISTNLLTLVMVVRFVHPLNALDGRIAS